MSRGSIFWEHGNWVFNSCSGYSSGVRNQWRSAEIVRFELPWNVLTVNTALHFWRLTIKHNLFWRLTVKFLSRSMADGWDPPYREAAVRYTSVFLKRVWNGILRMRELTRNLVRDFKKKMQNSSTVYGIWPLLRKARLVQILTWDVILGENGIRDRNGRSSGCAGCGHEVIRSIAQYRNTHWWIYSVVAVWLL